MYWYATIDLSEPVRDHTRFMVSTFDPKMPFIDHDIVDNDSSVRYKRVYLSFALNSNGKPYECNHYRFAKPVTS